MSSALFSSKLPGVEKAVLLIVGKASQDSAAKQTHVLNCMRGRNSVKRARGRKYRYSVFLSRAHSLADYKLLAGPDLLNALHAIRELC